RPVAEPLLQRPDALARTYDASGQIRREDGGARLRRKIPGLPIVKHRLFQKSVQTALSFHLPHWPAEIRRYFAERPIDPFPLGQRLPRQWLGARSGGAMNDEAILLQRLEPG